ncbi:MAG: DUF2189 domain-containing protein [Hyphomicrobiaceae bacterium]|nr:DUF2189 domain-containing protein [Hyphomicrobiaceae bacterium]
MNHTPNAPPLERKPFETEPRQVPLDAPWNWLAAGWRDLWQAPSIGLLYGAIIAAGAFGFSVFLLKFGALSLLLALAGGFFLVAPLFAVGLYETSRRLAMGQSITIIDSLLAGRGAKIQLALLGVVLTLIFIVWLQLAFVLSALFLGGGQLPQPSEFLQALLFTTNGIALLIVGTFVGAVLAGVVFALSTVSVPMLLDRRIDLHTACSASLKATLRNPRPMALWASLIVVMMAAGFVTLFIGLVVAFPLIGHATWHAYQDIYGEGSR